MASGVGVLVEMLSINIGRHMGRVVMGNSGQKLLGGTYVHWGRNAQAIKQEILSGYAPDEF